MSGFSRTSYSFNMRLSRRLLLAGIAAAVIVPSYADAHFILLEPASWLVENRLGDPQKLGPCGGTSADAGTPTNAIGQMKGGQKLKVKVQETVFHPGHYRVALAVNSRDELPPDPEVTTRETEKGPWSVSAAIQNPAKPPVIADGLFAHTARPTEAFETEIELPNINCRKCTLQVIQFMAEHGFNKDGGYSYHHCADLQITADATKPIDKRWPMAR
jgi:hypothetical protein